MPPTAAAPLLAPSRSAGRRGARRVPIGGFELEWAPLPTRGRRSPRASRALVVDLSISGAGVDHRGEPPLNRGAVVRIGLGGGAGTCVIRWSEPIGPRHTSYGVEFVWLDQVMDDIIADLVVGDRGSLDERWRLGR